MQTAGIGACCGAALAVLVGAAQPARAGWDPEVEKKLVESRYVYISSERKDGSFSKPAEIWFLFHQGAIWVASPVTTWRVRRIRAGRRRARIRIGALDGPEIEAVGELVKDERVHQVLFETFARKYPDHWPSYEPSFRKGLRDGSRVLVRYAPP